MTVGATARAAIRVSLWFLDRGEVDLWRARVLIIFMSAPPPK